MVEKFHTPNSRMFVLSSGIVRYRQTTFSPSSAEKCALICGEIVDVLSQLWINHGWWWRWDVCGAVKHVRVSSRERSTIFTSRAFNPNFSGCGSNSRSWILSSIINLRLHSTVARNLLSQITFLSHARQLSVECNHKKLSSLYADSASSIASLPW